MSWLKRVICFFIVFLFLSAGVFAMASQEPRDAAPHQAQAGWSDGWYEGADGYIQAVAEYEKTGKAMAVYVNVTWCPYCRKFEKGILSDPQVKTFMKDIIKVRINPETSDREAAITFQYRVMGFPSFFVHPAQQGTTVQLYTGVSPQQFIGLFEKVIKK